MAKKQKKLEEISKKFGEERQKALDTALKNIEKDFGKGAIMRLGERAEQKVQVMSSGSLALDIALGAGGYPKGRIIEIYGPESSGKTTVALHIDPSVDAVSQAFPRVCLARSSPSGSDAPRLRSSQCSCDTHLVWWYRSPVSCHAPEPA